MAEVLRGKSADYALEGDDGVVILGDDGLELALNSGGRIVCGAVERQGEKLRVHYKGLVYDFEIGPKGRPRPAAAPTELTLHAPMTGKIVKVFVSEGDVVASGAPLVVVEAMKMEHKITAPSKGTVARVHVEAGGQAEAGDDLVTLLVGGAS